MPSDRAQYTCQADKWNCQFFDSFERRRTRKLCYPHTLGTKLDKLFLCVHGICWLHLCPIFPAYWYSSRLETKTFMQIILGCVRHIWTLNFEWISDFLLHFDWNFWRFVCLFPTWQVSKLWHSPETFLYRNNEQIHKNKMVVCIFVQLWVCLNFVCSETSIVHLLFYF